MHSKAALLYKPKAFLLHKLFFSVLKRHPILQTKSFPFEQAFRFYSQKPSFFEPKAFLLHRPFFTIPSNPFLPSISHSHPAITYCPPKNDAVLFIFALNPHAVTPEPRTDSKPFRRRFVRKTGFGSCRRKYLQNYLRQSFESSPGVQRVATLWGTFGSFRTSEKNKTVPLRESSEVFQTSNQPTQTTTSH